MTDRFKAVPLATIATASRVEGASAGLGVAAAVSPGTASASDTATLTGGDMSEFVGSGFIEIFPAAQDQSSAFGSDIEPFSINTRAGAEVAVTCTFDDVTAPVPLPASLPLLLAGMGALHLLRRRQRG